MKNHKKLYFWICMLFLNFVLLGKFFLESLTNSSFKNSQENRSEEGFLGSPLLMLKENREKNLLASKRKDEYAVFVEFNALRRSLKRLSTSKCHLFSIYCTSL